MYRKFILLVVVVKGKTKVQNVISLMLVLILVVVIVTLLKLIKLLELNPISFQFNFIKK